MVKEEFIPHTRTSDSCHLLFTVSLKLVFQIRFRLRFAPHLTEREAANNMLKIIENSHMSRRWLIDFWSVRSGSIYIAQSSVSPLGLIIYAVILTSKLKLWAYTFCVFTSASYQKPSSSCDVFPKELLLLASILCVRTGVICSILDLYGDPTNHRSANVGIISKGNCLWLKLWGIFTKST